MESYESILQRMEEAYEAESGRKVEAVSDLGLRLRVLAGELYRMQAGIQWLKRQAFPQTAVGEELDLHGAQRGVLRREAQKARGSVTFSRYIPLSFDLVVPKGTVCAASGEEAAEYETLEDGILPAGELSVEVPARAVLGGRAGNAAAGYVNTLATPVAGIEYAVNQKDFTGGADREDDESYRTRVLAAYARLVNCGNAGYYEAAALAVEGVTSAQAVPRENGAGTVGIYVWGNGAAPPTELLENLAKRLNEEREIGVTVNVKPAQAAVINVSARLIVGEEIELEQARAEGKSALEAWFSARQVGDPVYLGDLSRVLLTAIPAKGLEYPVNMRDTAPAAGKIPVLGAVNLEVTL